MGKKFIGLLQIPLFNNKLLQLTLSPKEKKIQKMFQECVIWLIVPKESERFIGKKCIGLLQKPVTNEKLLSSQALSQKGQFRHCYVIHLSYSNAFPVFLFSSTTRVRLRFASDVYLDSNFHINEFLVLRKASHCFKVIHT